jgi:hypothetical protein
MSLGGTIMSRKEDYERLLDDIESCLFKAQAMQLVFAPELIKMTFLEISNCRDNEVSDEQQYRAA